MKTASLEDALRPKRKRDGEDEAHQEAKEATADTPPPPSKKFKVDKSDEDTVGEPELGARWIMVNPDKAASSNSMPCGFESEEADVAIELVLCYVIHGFL